MNLFTYQIEVEEYSDPFLKERYQHISNKLGQVLKIVRNKSSRLWHFFVFLSVPTVPPSLSVLLCICLGCCWTHLCIWSPQSPAIKHLLSLQYMNSTIFPLCLHYKQQWYPGSSQILCELIIGVVDLSSLYVFSDLPMTSLPQFIKISNFVLPEALNLLAHCGCHCHHLPACFITRLPACPPCCPVGPYPELFYPAFNDLCL